MRPGAMLGSSVWVVSRRWVRLVVWRSVCVACAGYLRCACWCGCVDGGGLSAFLPVELVPALGGCLCAVYAVVCGGGGGGRCAGRLVGVVGCGCACGRVLGGQLVLSMVRGWCMLCVDGAGVGVWGLVLDVGASPARCGRA